MENPEFLKAKYGSLHTSPEVESAAKRTEKRTGEKVGQKPSERIQNYLERFKEIVERKDEDKRQRGLDAIKQILHKEYIIKPGVAADEYIDRQKRMAREQGHGDLDVPEHTVDEVRNATVSILSGKVAGRVMRDFPNEQKQMVEEIVAMVEEQKRSLDQWLDYLASPDATYPDWLKYWTIRNITGLAEYNKDKKVFPKRTEKTTNPFPDLNREALAYVLDAIEKKYKGQQIDVSNLGEQEEQQKFLKLLQSENFAKLYAWAMEKVVPASAELLTITEGKWVKYKQGQDHMALVQSIQPHGTGWCTAGESTAESQLSRGDFYVYYSLDEQGKPTIPRAAIRMEGDKIAEVRGIAEQQNLDPYIAPVVAEKLHDFPDGKTYEKKASDMKLLTGIEKKINSGQQLTKDELVFLYEINGTIEGFGYERDPRIDEIRSKRDTETDMLVVLECSKEQIAHNTSEINEKTKAFVGDLEPGIFTLLNRYNIEHAYTSFPEGKIRRDNIEIGGKSARDLEKKLENQKINISDYATDMLHSKDFIVQKNPEEITLIRLRVKDLGLECPTTDQLYTRAQELGLELCPSDAAPNYRLKYKNQPLNEWFRFGMKQIADRHGGPDVFYLGHNEDGLWLSSYWADPDDEWDPENEFVFCLRKSKT